MAIAFRKAGVDISVIPIIIKIRMAGRNKCGRKNRMEEIPAPIRSIVITIFFSAICGFLPENDDMRGCANIDAAYCRDRITPISEPVKFLDCKRTTAKPLIGKKVIQ